MRFKVGLVTLSRQPMQAQPTVVSDRVPRSTVDWKTSQADDFRTRGEKDDFKGLYFEGSLIL